MLILTVFFLLFTDTELDRLSSASYSPSSASDYLNVSALNPSITNSSNEPRTEKVNEKPSFQEKLRELLRRHGDTLQSPHRDFFRRVAGLSCCATKTTDNRSQKEKEHKSNGSTVRVAIPRTKKRSTHNTLWQDYGLL